MRILIFLLLLLRVPLTAQTDTSVATSGIPRLTIKTNLSPLLNPYKQALALAVDVRLAPRISADLGVGAIFNSINFANEKGETYRGLRLRAGFKYYLRQSARGAFHMGLEGKYQDIKHISFRQAFRQGQQYVQILPLERKVRTQGLAFRVGWAKYFGKNKRFMFEQFMGLGYQFHKVSLLHPPDAELIPDRGFLSFEYEPGKSSKLDILFGIHWGVALW